MNFHILTLFPEMIRQGLNTSILGRALDHGCITLETVDIREFSGNKHRKVDDYTYGGGAGMLMQAQPVYEAYSHTVSKIREGKKPRVIYVTPQGRQFDQRMAQELSLEEELVFLCGHYEGIDERVLEEIVTDYVSIGDYVLTGGELPAMVMVDAVARLIPGVLNNEASAETETFYNYLLEYPQYSRPEEWRGKKVPEVLLSGNHKRIREWRLNQSVCRTKLGRPDLYEKYARLQECRKQLMKEKLLHIGMIELINRGQARLLYSGADGVLLQDTVSEALMLTTGTKEAGEEILTAHAASFMGCVPLFVSHQEFMNSFVEEKFGLKLLNECYQAVYTKGIPLRPVRLTQSIQIERLDESHAEEITRHYHITDVEYIRNRLKAGWMYGAFIEGKLAGFAGMHEEGSMGMLEVFEEYRRQGIAAQLEACLINKMLMLDWIPFCQVYADNEASRKLQEKLGLYFSKEKIYWFTK